MRTGPNYESSWKQCFGVGVSFCRQCKTITYFNIKMSRFVEKGGCETEGRKMSVSGIIMKGKDINEEGNSSTFYRTNEKDLISSYKRWVN